MQHIAHAFRAKGFAFDLDGTLIDTTPLVVQQWREFAMEHGLDAEKILASSHGRRTIETLTTWVPEKATPELAKQMECILATKTDGVSMLPGVAALLDKVPSANMAVCTAGIRFMAESRLSQMGIPIPKVMSTGDSVSRGKPDPEGYLSAAERLGIQPRDCLVFEDAPAGVRAARAAGMNCIACATTHSVEELKDAGATCVVQFLTDVDIERLPDGSFNVFISKAL